jgi:hypothetical protein
MATPWATGRSGRPETLRIRLCVGDGAWPCVARYRTWHGYRPQRDIPRGTVWCRQGLPADARVDALARLHLVFDVRAAARPAPFDAESAARAPGRAGRVAQGLTVPRGIFALHGRLRRACRVPRRSGRPGEGTGSRNGEKRIDRPASQRSSAQ